jgi:hypothetical protein
MRSHGVPWGPTTVTKVEKGDRQVTVDELVALAYVLAVSPAALIVPTTWNEPLSVTPAQSQAASTVWRWIIGTFPLGGLRSPGEPLDVAGGEARQRFYEEACPDYIAAAERRLPGLRHLHEAVAGAQSSAGLPGKAGERSARFGELLGPRWVVGVSYALEQAHDDTGALLRRVRRLLRQKGDSE